MRLPVLALLISACAAPALAQSKPHDNCPSGPRLQSSYGKVAKTRVGKAPKWAGAAKVEPKLSWEITRLPGDSVRKIKAALEDCAFDDALDLYFGSARDSRLADWVVYIPKDGKARHIILQDGKSNGVYRSQRYVWAIVFAEKQDGAKDLFAVKKDSTYKGDIAFSRRVLKYEEDPFLNAMARVALTKLFSEASVNERSLADSTNYIQMSELSLDTLQSLYVGTARLGVIDNTQLVLSLYPEGEREFPKGLRSVYTNMVNSSPSWWEIGLATGVSYNREPARRVGFSGDTTANKRDTLDVSQRYNTSVLLNLYINIFGRPQLPLRYGAGSLVIGTSVPDLTEDLFLGIGVLTWKGKGGFVVGGLWEKDVVNDPDPANAGRVIRREAKFLRPFFGIDLRL